MLLSVSLGQETHLTTGVKFGHFGTPFSIRGLLCRFVTQAYTIPCAYTSNIPTSTNFAPKIGGVDVVCCW